MLWDGAGFHTSKKLRVPDNITVIQLPPYSPELNPMENLWHYLKSHYWSNRAYADYEELEEAAIDAWRTAVLDPELMKTVCNAPYLKRAVSKIELVELALIRLVFSGRHFSLPVGGRQCGLRGSGKGVVATPMTERLRFPPFLNRRCSRVPPQPRPAGRGVGRGPVGYGAPLGLHPMALQRAPP